MATDKICNEVLLTAHTRMIKNNELQQWNDTMQYDDPFTYYRQNGATAMLYANHLTATTYMPVEITLHK